MVGHGYPSCNSLHSEKKIYWATLRSSFYANITYVFSIRFPENVSLKHDYYFKMYKLHRKEMSLIFLQHTSELWTQNNPDAETVCIPSINVLGWELEGIKDVLSFLKAIQDDSIYKGIQVAGQRKPLKLWKVVGKCHTK